MTSLVPEVLSSADARKDLPNIVRRVSAGGTPVMFGRHRKAEAVIMSAAQYERMMSIIEDAEIAEVVRERAQETPGSPVDLADFAQSIGVSRDLA